MNFEDYWNDGFNSYDYPKDAARDAYEYQQNKIDSVLNKLCQLKYSSGERCYNEIKELLK